MEVTEIRTLPVRVEGEVRSALAVGDRGELVISQSVDDSHQLELWELGHREPTYVSPTGPGIFAAAIDRRYVVWVDTTAHDLFTMPWTMHSYDRRTGEARQIAEAPDVGVDPVPVAPDGTFPVVIGSRVYYAAVSAVTRGRTVPSIYSVPVDGSEPPRIEADDAFDPHDYLGDLIYVRAQTGTFRHWTITRRNLTDESEAMVAADRRTRMAGIIAHDDEILWQVADLGRDRCREVTLVPGQETPVTVTQRSCESGFAGYFEASDHWTGFSRIDQEKARGYRAFLVIGGEVRPFGHGWLLRTPRGAGDYIAWTEADRDLIHLGRLVD